MVDDRIRLFALAIATGTTVRKWARANGVPERTAYKWASSDTFKAMVARVRADLVNRTVGRLVTLSTAHVHNLDRIARDEAESGAVRVAASRAVLANLIELQNHADLAARVAELEKAARS